MKKCSTAEEKHRESEDTRHSEDGRTEGKQIWKITRMAVTAMAEK